MEKVTLTIILKPQRSIGQSKVHVNDIKTQRQILHNVFFSEDVEIAD